MSRVADLEPEQEWYLVLGTAKPRVAQHLQEPTSDGSDLHSTNSLIPVVHSGRRASYERKRISGDVLRLEDELTKYEHRFQDSVHCYKVHVWGTDHEP